MARAVGGAGHLHLRRTPDRCEDGCVNERQRLSMLRELFAEGLAAGAGGDTLSVGIGDDAAVLRPDGPVVVSNDALVDEIHFRRSWMDEEAIGYRATMAALSDLAAMGATPLGVVSGLILPEDFDDEMLRRLAVGQRRAASEVGTVVIGGNLAKGAQLSITSTVLGVAARPLLRTGAKEGDVLAVVGTVGLARAGLEALLSDAPFSPGLAPALDAFRAPKAHIAAGRVLSEVAHACIDLSDGLALDAKRMAEDSDVAIIIEAEGLLTPELELAAAAVGRPPVTLALEGGDDYALLVALAPEDFEAVTTTPMLRRIGHVEAGEGLWMAETTAESGRVPVDDGGYDHFA